MPGANDARAGREPPRVCVGSALKQRLTLRAGTFWAPAWPYPPSGPLLADDQRMFWSTTGTGSGVAPGIPGSMGHGAGDTSTVLPSSLLGEACTFSIRALPK